MTRKNLNRGKFPSHDPALTLEHAKSFVSLIFDIAFEIALFILYCGADTLKRACLAVLFFLR
jgi:hypothetical protein